MYKTYESGHIPLIYMHPYEMVLDHEFWLSWQDLNRLPLAYRFYTWLRQVQWSHIGHKTVEKKISYICNYFEHQGPMKKLVE